MKVNFKYITLFALACTFYSVRKAEAVAGIPSWEGVVDVVSAVAEVFNIATLDSTEADSHKWATYLSLFNRAAQTGYNCYAIDTTDGTDKSKAQLWRNNSDSKPLNIFPHATETYASLGLEGISAFLGDIPSLVKSKQLALYNKNVHRQQRLSAVKWSQAVWLAFNTALKAFAHFESYKHVNANTTEQAKRGAALLALRALALLSEAARRYCLYKAKFKGLDDWTEENLPAEGEKFLLPLAYTLPTGK